MFVFYKIKKRLKELIYPKTVKSWRRKGLRRENHRYRMCVKIMAVVLKYGKNDYVIEDKIAEKVGFTKRCVKKYISILKSWNLIEVKYGRGGGVKFNKEGLPDGYIFFCKRGTNSHIEQNNMNKKEINTFSVEKNKEISKKIDGIKEKMSMRGCSGVFGAVLVPKELLKEFYNTVKYAKDCFIAKNYRTGDYVAVSFKMLNRLVKIYGAGREVIMIAIYSFADWVYKKIGRINKIFNVERQLMGFIKSDLNFNGELYNSLRDIELKRLEQSECYASKSEIERLIRGITGDKTNNRHRGGEVQSIKDIIQCMVVGDPVLERKGQKDGGVLS